jgi:hypothetical protein
MNSDLQNQILDMIETQVRSRPSAFEFEMAYQARVAIDRIKFAINHAEQFCPRTEHTREVGLQLLDALDRLESRSAVPLASNTSTSATNPFRFSISTCPL